MSLHHPIKAAFFLLIIALTGIGGQAATAHAQAQYTDAEKAAFAFYRLGGFAPNFRNWIEQMESYAKTPEAEREHFVTRQLIRLEQGFLNFNPAHEPMELLLSAYLHYPNEDERAEYDREVRPYPVEISIRHFEDGFFPYRIANNWIALIPESLNALLTVRMSAAEFGNFRHLLGLPSRASRRVVRVEMLLVPHRIEGEQPIEVKGQTLWPLYAQVARIRIIHPLKREISWPIYQADWYRTATDDSLLNLYRP